MSIYFRFGEFRANSICPFLGKVMPNFCKRVYAYICMIIIVLIFFNLHRAGNMKKNLMNVTRFLEAAVADMHENNRKEIKCPCRKCKEQVWIDPFKGGHLKAHLVMKGFMNG